MLFQGVAGTGLNPRRFAGLGRASRPQGDDTPLPLTLHLLAPDLPLCFWVQASQGRYANRPVAGVVLPTALCAVRRPLRCSPVRLSRSLSHSLSLSLPDVGSPGRAL